MATTNEQEKINIWIRIADLPAIPLSINRDDEPSYRETERLVKKLWDKWNAEFSEICSPLEVMARVAFQFALLYAQEYNRNVAVNDFLTTFEKKLDEVVVKI